MKITVNEQNNIQLEEVFNPIVFRCESGEKLSICMRDTGFEFSYQDKMYFAKGGFVEPLNTSSRVNILVEQEHREYNDNIPHQLTSQFLMP